MQIRCRSWSVCIFGTRITVCFNLDCVRCRRCLSNVTDGEVGQMVKSDTRSTSDHAVGKVYTQLSILNSVYCITPAYNGNCPTSPSVTLFDLILPLTSYPCHWKRFMKPRQTGCAYINSITLIGCRRSNSTRSIITDHIYLAGEICSRLHDTA